jgi:hypothetical protein
MAETSHMNLKRVLLLGVGGGALVTWITTAATSMSQPPRATAAVPSPRAVATSGAALAAEIDRLHERLRPSAVPLQARDLFSYVAHQPPAAGRQLAAVAAVPAALPQRAAPPLTLAGIAEDGPAGAIVRTAVVSGLGDLFLVKEGEVIAARYRVVAVEGAAVELFDTVEQAPLRLTLP